VPGVFGVDLCAESKSSTSKLHRQKALFAAIELMEAEERKEQSKERTT
jgi:hypothetical protein